MYVHLLINIVFFISRGIIFLLFCLLKIINDPLITKLAIWNMASG